MEGNKIMIQHFMTECERDFRDLRDGNGHSLLHITSGSAHYEATEFLLNAGFDINLKANDGSMPLHHAVNSGSSHLVDLLLSRNALPDEASQGGYRPIHLAVLSKNRLIVERLLSVGVKLDDNLMQIAVEKSDERIITLIRNKLQELLMNAAKNGDISEVQNCLYWGADLSFIDDAGWSALHWAVKNGHIDVVKTILLIGVKLDSNLMQIANENSDKSMISLIRNKLQELLMNAAKNGDISEVQNCLHWGADPSFRDDAGWSALHWAVKNGHIAVVERLLSVGVKLDDNLMQIAVEKSDERIITLIRNKLPELLMNAAMNGDIFEVQNCLHWGVDPSFRDDAGWSALHWAVKNGHIGVVETLLRMGVKLDNNLMQIANEISDERIITLIRNKLQELSKALMEAAMNGDISEVQNCLHQGADPSFTDGDGWTALHWAVNNGHIDVINILSKLCADLKNGCNESALYLAVVNKRLNAVDILYNNNCDMNAKIGPKDNTALHQAVVSGNMEMTKKLLECGVETDVLNNEGEAALHIAVKIGNPKIIDQFMLHSKKKTIDFNIKTSDGCTPLYFAALEDKLWITTKLIEAGSDVNATNGKDKWTALHIAVQERNTEIVRALLERKADITLLDNNRYSALHYAVLKGYADVVDKFISAKFNLNVLDNYGNSLLHIAVEKQHSEIIEKLLKAGVNLCLKNNAGKTPLDLAKATSNSGIIKIITEAVTSLDGLVDDIKAGNVDSVTKLLKAGASLSTKGQDNCYPIHHAAQMGNLNIINILLKAGADVNVKNSRGETPLILAIINNHLDVVIALLNAGSDMNAANDENKWSALHFAAYNGDEEIISALLKKNCKELIRDNNGDCPIHLAAYHGKTDVIKSFKSLKFKSKDNETPLYLAVSEKHYETVKELLKYDCDKNATNGDQESTVLHRAVAIEDESLIEMLLKHKVNEALVDKNDLTALHLAVTTNKPNIIKAFKNSNLNLKNAAKITPLYLAVQNGFRDVALELIKLGCNINAKNCNEEFTALHQAFLSNNTEIIKILLENKADMTIKDKNGSTVMHMVAEKGKTSMIQHFKGYNINVKNAQDETPLYLAVRNCNYGTTSLLLQEGSKINEKNGEDQYTVLHEAVRRANEEILEVLLAVHPDTSLLDKKGFTALHYAIQQDNLAIVKMFISKNIDLNNKNKDGNTPLHDAVKYKKISIIEALLNSKADQSLHNAKGHCPLHIAVDEEKIIDCFIKNKAKLWLLTRDGKTVLQMAMIRHKDDLNKCKTLIEVCGINMKDNRGCTLLHDAVRNKNINVVKMLLKLGASAGCKDDEERSALIYAISAKNIEMVEILYAYILDAFSETDKYLPLQIAVEVRNRAIVILLLKKGYNVNLTNYQNKHALHLAIEKNDIAMVELLLKKGASVDHEDTGSLNILHHVAECGNEDIVEKLLSKSIKEMDIKNSKKKTPLETAKCMDQRKADMDEIQKGKLDKNYKGTE